MPDELGHAPVLLSQVLELLVPPPAGIVIDCTVGRAGHALAIANRLGPDGLLIGLDVDPANLEFANRRLASAPCRVRLFHANFAELDDVLAQAGHPPVDCLFADLGISTNQLLDPRYGLTFSADAPLDMRIDPRLDQSAADLIASISQSDLADLLFNLAQERFSRRIARKIVEARQISPIHTTTRLAALVRSVLPRGKSKIDPATRTFLALRIAVNHECENLDALLRQGLKVLRPGGRLGLISFQSTEDARIKHALRSAEQTGLLKLITPRPLQPDPAEIAANPRSRSAKLRVAQMCAADPRTEKPDVSGQRRR
jgi:16S rRNA (cytosine1402-N4)-methyltransferase